MQAFLLGNTALLGWTSVAVMAGAALLAAIAAFIASPALDRAALGESTARSLGLPLARLRLVLIAAFALATGAAVAQTGIVAFVGLVAPHLARAATPVRHGRWCCCPLLPAVRCCWGLMCWPWPARAAGLPVGLVTALLGGGYLLVLLHRRWRPRR